MQNKLLRIASFIPVLMLSIFLSDSVQAHTPGEHLILWPSIELDAAGVPHVAFSDANNDHKISVKKFEKGDWVPVGSPGFSPGLALMPSLSLSSAGVLHVVFFGGPSVMKFEKGAWVSVKLPDPVPDQMKNLPPVEQRIIPDSSWGRHKFYTMTLDAYGVPHVALSQSDKANGSKLQVAKFERGVWVLVASLDISPKEGAFPPSLAFDNTGGVWVAFTDPEHDNKLSVKQRKGNTWVSVGQPGFTPGRAGFPSLKISSAGVPFVAFQDVEKSGTFSVMKFEKGTWVYAGEAGFSSGGVLPSLALSKAGVPYLAYMEYGRTNEGKLVVMKLEGKDWVKVESQESASVSKSCQIKMLDRSTLYTRKQCQQAAEQGDAQAQYYVGKMYAGYGVARDDKEAVKWVRKAAEQGLVNAQYDLGVTYTRGEGVARDDAEAAKWFRKAAEQGDKGALSHLAVMYAEGQGVPQDDTEAVKWARMAWGKDDPATLFSIGMSLRDPEKKVKWIRKAAEQGSVEGQHHLGLMYARGRGVARDDLEAVKWYRKAAEQGYKDAQRQLGLMYAKGRGVPQDDAEAVKWFKLASPGQDEASVLFTLGRWHTGGIQHVDVVQDDVEVAKWYKRAAEQGHKEAQYALGRMYVKGEGVAKDDAEAMKWYRKAAEQGHVFARKALEGMEK